MRSPWSMHSGDLLPGNHALRRERNLMRAGGAKLLGISKRRRTSSIVTTSSYRNAFQQPEPGRSDVDCSLGIVERIRLIGTPFRQRPCQLHGVFSGDEFMRNPCPIVLGICVLSGTFVAGICGRIGHRFDQRGSSRSKVLGLEMESLGYSTVTRWAGSYFWFRNPGRRRTRLQSVQAGSPPKAIASNLSRRSCCSNVKLIDPPEHLVFAGRCREDCGRNRDRIRAPNRSKSGLAIRVDI